MAVDFDKQARIISERCNWINEKVLKYEYFYLKINYIR